MRLTFSSRLKGFGCLVSALLFFSFSAQAQVGRLEIVTPSQARAALISRWNDFRIALERGEIAAARENLKQVLESKLDGGMVSLPVYGLALVRLAGKSYRQGDPETAQWLAGSAKEMAPGSVAVHLALARYYLGGGPVSPVQSFKCLLEAGRAAGEDFPFLFRMLGAGFLLPVIIFMVMGGVFTAVSLFRYGVPFFHDFMDLCPQGRTPKPLVLAVFLVMLFLPLGAGLSWVWLLSFIMVLLSLYMERRERLFVYIWFIFLLISPWLFDRYTLYAGAVADEALQACLRARNGTPEAGDTELLEEELSKRPDNLLARFCLAGLLQKEGRFNRAVSVYKPLLEDPRTSQAAYNNLAEIYMWGGELDTVYRALTMAVKNGPPRLQISFNLAQYYKEAGQLLKMEEKLKEARAIDEQGLERLLLQAKKPRLNRFMARIPAPASLVWKQAKTSGLAAVGAAGPGIWHRFMGPPRGLYFFALCLVFLAAVFGFQLMRHKWKLSYRCALCGQPICESCRQGPSKDPSICKHCYSVFRGAGGVDLKEKMRKRTEVQRYRDLVARVSAVSSLLFPGSGHLLLGRSLAGFLLLAPASLALAGLLCGLFLWPEALPPYREGFSWHEIAILLVYTILIVFSFLSARKTMETTGW